MRALSHYTCTTRTETHTHTEIDAFNIRENVVFSREGTFSKLALDLRLSLFQLENFKAGLQIIKQALVTLPTAQTNYRPVHNVHDPVSELWINQLQFQEVFSIFKSWESRTARDIRALCSQCAFVTRSD